MTRLGEAGCSSGRQSAEGEDQTVTAGSVERLREGDKGRGREPNSASFRQPVEYGDAVGFT